MNSYIIVDSARLNTQPPLFSSVTTLPSSNFPLPESLLTSKANFDSATQKNSKTPEVYSDVKIKKKFKNHFAIIGKNADLKKRFIKFVDEHEGTRAELWASILERFPELGVDESPYFYTEYDNPFTSLSSQTEDALAQALTNNTKLRFKISVFQCATSDGSTPLTTEQDETDETGKRQQFTNAAITSILCRNEIRAAYSVDPKLISEVLDVFPVCVGSVLKTLKRADNNGVHYAGTCPADKDMVQIGSALIKAKLRALINAGHSIDYIILNGNVACTAILHSKLNKIPLLEYGIHHTILNSTSILVFTHYHPSALQPSRAGFSNWSYFALRSAFTILYAHHREDLTRKVSADYLQFSILFNFLVTNRQRWSILAFGDLLMELEFSPETTYLQMKDSITLFTSENKLNKKIPEEEKIKYPSLFYQEFSSRPVIGISRSVSTKEKDLQLKRRLVKLNREVYDKSTDGLKEIDQKIVAATEEMLVVLKKKAFEVSVRSNKSVARVEKDKAVKEARVSALKAKGNIEKPSAGAVELVAAVDDLGAALKAWQAKKKPQSGQDST